MRRYYSITLTRTLFDEWCIVCIWGRLCGGGQMRQYTITHELDARNFFDKLIKKRYARKYQLGEGVKLC